MWYVRCLERVYTVFESRKMKRIKWWVVGVGLMLVSSAGMANTIYTFGANGTTEGISQRGTATFNFASPSLLTITLSDDVVPTSFIASELAGLIFTFSSALSGQSLGPVIPSAVINCTGSTSPCPPGTGSTPYGWGTTLSGNTLSLGAGFSGGTFAYHPYAIVNSSYSAPGGNGGLSNPEHNPLLVGPVTFNLTLTGLTSIPDITSVSFLFGTVPDSQSGTCTSVPCGGIPPQVVPEPRSLALVGLGMLLLAWFGRRRLFATRVG
jgi:hypothetical protein